MKKVILRGGKLGQGVGALKTGGGGAGTPLQTIMLI